MPARAISNHRRACWSARGRIITVKRAMPSGKKWRLFCFALSCVMTALFLYGAVFGRRFLFMFIFLPLFFGLSCFAGYRLFCFPDDWSRAREEQSRVWWSRHKRLEAVLVIISTAGILRQMAQIIHRHHCV